MLDLRDDPPTIARLAEKGLQPVSRHEATRMAKRTGAYKVVEASALTQKGCAEAIHEIIHAFESHRSRGIESTSWKGKRSGFSLGVGTVGRRIVGSMMRSVPGRKAEAGQSQEEEGEEKKVELLQGTLAAVENGDPSALATCVDACKNVSASLYEEAVSLVQAEQGKPACRVLLPAHMQHGPVSHPSLHSYLNSDVCAVASPTVQVLFLGHGRAGKTTIVENLRSGKKAPKVRLLRKLSSNAKGSDARPSAHVTPSTIAMEVHDDLDCFASKGCPAFRILDFAGQLEYIPVHEYFLGSTCSVYVIVVDASSPLDECKGRLYYWLNHALESLPGGTDARNLHSLAVKFLLVATQADKLSAARQKLVKEELQGMKTSLVDSVFLVSGATGAGLHKLRARVAKLGNDLASRGRLCVPKEIAPQLTCDSVERKLAALPLFLPRCRILGEFDNRAEMLRAVEHFGWVVRACTDVQDAAKVGGGGNVKAGGTQDGGGDCGGEDADSEGEEWFCTDPSALAKAMAVFTCTSDHAARSLTGGEGGLGPMESPVLTRAQAVRRIEQVLLKRRSRLRASVGGVSSLEEVLVRDDAENVLRIMLALQLFFFFSRRALLSCMAWEMAAGEERRVATGEEAKGRRAVVFFRRPPQHGARGPLPPLLQRWCAVQSAAEGNAARTLIVRGAGAGLRAGESGAGVALP
eukprot:TRINITY_DN2389_c3_g1_i2.p1 TRINITY_DN2389_c3_g1~~TRINITY_DN2389_c3_g1_i2.p1  ORF type:complete len:809 (+),score=133.72 TRINITY_DN2389_c3_g1_i2:352-2427(+)